MGDVNTYDVFFSYHGRDHAAVEAVAQALRQQGLNVFLDRWYLIPGRPWPQVLEEIIASCRSVAVFVGPQGMGPWQQREKFLALSRQVHQPQFPVIPVLLPGADPALGFLEQHTWVDLRQKLDDPLSLELLNLAVQGQAPGPDLAARVQATLASVCPYRGLRPFREEDASFFFGREVFIDRLTQAVCCRALVALVGASGCGKSSVARAGLIPRLRREGGGQVWESVTLLPGDRPLHSLAAALLPLLEPEMTEVDRLAEVKKLAEYLQKGDLALRDVVARVLAKQPGTDRLLLVADQWEELYTLTREEEQRSRFLDEVLQATQDSPLSVVLTLRGDFFGQALSYRPLADRLQDAVVTLGPMTREELAQAVAQPAAQVGLAFESGLVERLLDDVGQEPGNLPLLEFALTNLWERRQGGQLLHQVYDDMGRVQGAVAQQAEEIYQKLVPLEQQAAARVFLELVQTGEGTEDTRRRAALGEVGEEARGLVKKLADARLVVTGREEATGQETVEVAHEALIQNWQRLQGWLNADREFLLWRQRLRHDLENWERTNHDAEVLLRGTLLAEAQGWLAQKPADLSPGERHLIQASVALKEREEEEKREKQRREVEQAQALAAEQQRRAEAERQRAETERRSRGRLSLLTVALLVVFLGAIGVAGFVWVQRNQAIKQTKIAFSQQLAAQAISLLDSQLDLALLLSVKAVEAYKANPTVPAKNALLTALQKEPRLRRYLRGHKDDINSVAFSPDGKTLASGSKDWTIRLWDVATGQPRGAPLIGHKQMVGGVAFGPDGKLLASGSSDDTIRLWDVATGQPLGAPLTGHRGWVGEVAFSPDGKTLASGSGDGTIRLWDVETSRPRGAPLEGHRGQVGGVAFSPDGKILASAGSEGTIRLWDVATGQPRGVPLTGHQGNVSGVAFSPDSKTLASGGLDKTVRLWDVATGQPRGVPLIGDQSWVTSVAFSPDGKTLISGSHDKTIRLWDVGTGKPRGSILACQAVFSVAFSSDGKTLASGGDDNAVRLFLYRGQSLGAPLTGHQDRVQRLAFSPDGKTLATGGFHDDTVKLWDVATGQPRGAPLTGHQDRVQSLAFSPDGKTLASGSYDKTIRLWDVGTGQPHGAPLTGHQAGVSSVTFSPDGKTLASGSSDTIRLWDVATGQPRGAPLTGHQGWVGGVAFSPDGKTLASGSGDSTIRLWDVETGRSRGSPLTGHQKGVTSVAFSPDGKTLASGSEDKTVRLWDVATSQPRGAPLIGHQSFVSCVAFSPDGKILASGSLDETIRLWDVVTGQPQGAPLIGGGPYQQVNSLAFSPDGTTLASGSADQTVMLWDVDVQSWIKRACAIANRNLTQEEWRRYMGDRPYRKTCPDLPGAEITEQNEKQ